MQTEGEKISVGFNKSIDKADKALPNQPLLELEEQTTIQAQVALQKDLNFEFSPSRSSYEDPENTVYIQIDDVCCKEQKKVRGETETKDQEKLEEKRKAARKLGKKPYQQSKYLFQTITHIMRGQQYFSMVHSKPGITLTDSIKAFLNEVDSQSANLVFLIDGQQTLYTYIVNAFTNQNVKLVLDWYHLAKKVTSQLHIGVKRSEYRENLDSTIKHLLWHNQVTQAINVVKNIEEKAVKNPDALRILIGYFERNKTIIQNYAMRKKLSLQNSTARVEKQNDVIVAKRQKRNGMSWSRFGSNNIAQITTIYQNKQHISFHRSGKYELKWAS